MQSNPAAEWQSLTEHYRAMCDEDLEELAADFTDLTETAQQVLRNEMKNRGLDRLQTRAEPQTNGEAQKQSDAPPQFRSSVDPDSYDRQTNSAEQSTDEDASTEYTWKTPLCECETTDQGRQLQEVLKRAGIESWIEAASAGLGGYLRIQVAADQLDQAIEIASQPIPQDIVDRYREKVPEYEAPKCPKCGAQDPVLEAVDPVSSWLCEACGEQWAESADGIEAAPDGAER
jgi:hypothetical protein